MSSYSGSPICLHLVWTSSISDELQSRAALIADMEARSKYKSSLRICGFGKLWEFRCYTFKVVLLRASKKYSDATMPVRCHSGAQIGVSDANDLKIIPSNESWQLTASSKTGFHQTSLCGKNRMLLKRTSSYSHFRPLTRHHVRIGRASSFVESIRLAPLNFILCKYLELTSPVDPQLNFNVSSLQKSQNTSPGPKRAPE